MSEGLASSADQPLVAGDSGVAPVEAAAPVTTLAEAPAAAVETTETPAAEGAATESPEAEVPAEAAAEPSVEGDKPAEGVEGEAAKADGEAKPEVKSYEDFKLPEGMSIESAQTSAFGNILSKYGLTQEAGQELMDFGGSIIKQTQEKMAQAQVDAFAETRRGWVSEFESQAGNRRNTMLNDARAAIRDAVPDDKARADLWSVLAFTGAGDHPAVIKAFAAIGKRARERTSPTSAVPSAPSTTPAERRYGRRN